MEAEMRTRVCCICLLQLLCLHSGYNKWFHVTEYVSLRHCARHVHCICRCDTVLTVMMVDAPVRVLKN